MKNRFTLLLVFCFTTLLSSAQVVDVITGLDFAAGLALKGNDLYIADDGTKKLYKIDITQSTPTLTTVLSNIDAFGLALKGNELYMSDINTGRIQKIDVTLPNPVPVTVITGLDFPTGLFFIDDELYVAEFSGNRVSKFNITDPNPISTIVAAGLNGPVGLVLKNNELYISEFSGNNVQKIDISVQNPPVVLVSGGFSQPVSLTLNGNFIYVSEGSGNKISRIDIGLSNPVPEIIVDGLDNPRYCAFDGLDLYIAIAGGTVPGDGDGKVVKLQIGQPSFSVLGSVCSNTMPNDLGGASPTGGTYSGPGVTDNGNGETFSFDPAAAGGPGTYTITYTAINGSMVTSMLTVAAAPVVTAPAGGSVPLDFVGPLFDGTPGGGVYTGPGVLPGNQFSAYLAGVGTHTMTYTVTDANGCSGSDDATFSVTPGANDACSGATLIDTLLGGALNVSQVSREFNNTGYNTISDPTTGLDCFVDTAPYLEHTVWYTFTGDGSTYRIRSVNCNNAAPYLSDSQVAIYSGACGNLAPVACNDDEDEPNQVYNFSIDLPTQNGTSYRMLVDGYNFAEGRFCLEVTKTGVSSVIDISQTNIQVFPNPTEGDIQLRNVTAEKVEVMDYLGRLVLSDLNPGSNMDISQVADGIYFLKIYDGNHVYTTKVVKQ